MSTLTGWLKLLGAVAVVLGALYPLVNILVKRFPPRATGLAKELETMRARVDQVEKDADDKVRAAQQETAECRADLRLLTDYVHDLREHIAERKEPPPPDWPKGLRL